MQQFTSFRLSPLAIAISSSLLLVACGGGGSSSTTTSSAPTDAPVQSLGSTLTGVVATGAPMANAQVQVRCESLSQDHTATTEDNGTYKVELPSTQRGACVIKATGVSSNGDPITLHSAIEPPARTDRAEQATVNVTPLTDSVVALAIPDDGKKESPTEFFDNFKNNDGTQRAKTVDKTNLNNAKDKVQAVLQDYFDVLDVPKDANGRIDVVQVPFAADKTGMDRVMDAVDVAWDGTDQSVKVKPKDPSKSTVEIKKTDSKEELKDKKAPISDDVNEIKKDKEKEASSTKTPGTTTSSPTPAPKPVDAVSLIDTDLTAVINRAFTKATVAEARVIFTPLVDDAYLDNGKNKVAFVDGVMAGDNPPAPPNTTTGNTGTAGTQPNPYAQSKLAPLSVLQCQATPAKERVCEVAGTISKANGTLSMRFTQHIIKREGQPWRFFGNQRVVDLDIHAVLQKYVYMTAPTTTSNLPASTSEYRTGLSIRIDNRGSGAVKSAKVWFDQNQDGELSPTEVVAQLTTSTACMNDSLVLIDTQNNQQRVTCDNVLPLTDVAIQQFKNQLSIKNEQQAVKGFKPFKLQVQLYADTQFKEPIANGNYGIQAGELPPTQAQLNENNGRLKTALFPALTENSLKALYAFNGKAVLNLDWTGGVPVNRAELNVWKMSTSANTAAQNASQHKDVFGAKQVQFDLSEKGLAQPDYVGLGLMSKMDGNRDIMVRYVRKVSLTDSTQK